MTEQSEQLRTQFTRESIIEDYRVAFRSRQASLIGRKEVLTGKAKFGIFGDGKEVAQLAMARAFRKGDWRSGYYRDQTFILATGMGTLDEFFAQLYADPDVAHDPWSGGRSMNAHFASRLLNPDGSWKNQTDAYNTSADVSPTGSQMPRLLGIAWASKLYREVDLFKSMTQFSRDGDEIAWGTSGTTTTASRSPTNFRSPRGICRSCSRDFSATRKRSRASTFTRSRAGTIPRYAKRTSTPPPSCAWSTFRRSSTSSR